MHVNSSDTKKPISLKDVISPSIMGPIEAMEWMDAGKLVVRANDAVEVIDYDASPRKNWTLFDSDALVSF